MGVHLRHVTKEFKGQHGPVVALRELTLDVRDGEFVCVVGPSGCGKTTLLRLVAGLVRPTSGEVRVDRQPGSPRLESALVFQESGLFPWLTVLENIGLGLEFQRVGLRQRHPLELAAIERLGLAEFSSSYPYQLSGGMRQRVAVARAFLAEPQCLLMDEPFGSLDAQSRRVLQEELLETWRRQPTTVIYVTHDIEEASLLADRLVVLSGRPGRVIDEISVELDRPRMPFDRDADVLKQIRRRVWGMLEREVRRDLHVGEPEVKRDSTA